jgi:hypothetical protein
LDRLIKTTIVIALLFSTTIWSQKSATNTIKDVSKNTNETIYLQTNTTTLVTGETLYYKLYCLNSNNFKQSQLSKVAYVELIGNDKKIIFNHKLFLENGTGQGDYFIPSSILSGTYKLIGFTKWMLNKESSKSFEIDITVINPFQNDGENLISTKTEIIENNSITNNGDFIKTDKTIYSSREKVNLNIGNLQKGNYSISVRKVQDLPTVKKINSIDFSKISDNESVNFANPNITLPELRGEIISGKIIAKDNSQPINEIAIGLSIPGKSFEFKLVKTDKNGRFIFSIDKAYYENNFVIQVLNDYKEDYTITLDKPNYLDTTNLKIENEKKLSFNLKSIIEEHSISSQIENTFFEKKADTLQKIKTYPEFYEPIAKEYILDNYTRFPTIKETITEVVKEMHYYKDNDKYTFYLADYDPNTELSEPPLVLVDGLLIQDINELLEYRSSNIYKICIIQSGYYYNNKIFNGVISFITKKNDFNSNLSGDFILKTNITPPLAKKSYYKPDYSDKTNNERIPDYRYQLLWLPDLKLNNDNQISFFTSDKTGNFEIVLEGFTEDGNPISMKNYFEVK